MSSLPPLQCLFCNHLNPAGASFCNDCGSQMHLQPCDRCGAINKRTARNCYKCDAGFTLPAAPETASTPALHDSQVADLPANDGGIAKAPTPAPPDPAYAPPQPMQVYEIVSSGTGAMATGSGRTLRLAVPAILLAAMTVSVYYYFGPSAALPKRQGATQAAPGVSVTPVPASVALPTVAAQAEAASASIDTTPKLAAGTSGLDEALSLAPPGAGAAMTPRRSPPPDVQVTPRQDPPLLKECPEAVAALGLCNASTKQEKP